MFGLEKGRHEFVRAETFELEIGVVGLFGGKLAVVSSEAGGFGDGLGFGERVSSDLLEGISFVEDPEGGGGWAKVPSDFLFEIAGGGGAGVDEAAGECDLIE